MASSRRVEQPVVVPPAAMGRTELRLRFTRFDCTSMASKYAPAPSSNRTSPATAAAPIRTLRLGRIKAAVWENSTEQRPFYNVTFARTYMDSDKKFRDTDSFGRDDLLLLAKLADQAHTFVCEQMAAQKSEELPDQSRRG